MLEKIQNRSTKMISDWMHLSYEDRLRELALFILETGKLLGNCRADFHHLKGAYRKDWDRLIIE